MKKVECVHGPLDGVWMAVDSDVVCIFYAPPRNENTTYRTAFAKLGEVSAPPGEPYTGVYATTPEDRYTARWWPK